MSQFPRPEMQEIGKPPRCGERSQEGARCIYDEGHRGEHFAKDSFSYYSWQTPRQRSSVRYKIGGVRVNRRLFWWWQTWRYGWPW